MSKIIFTFRALGVFFSLLLLCSCATTNRKPVCVAATDLPADVTMNRGAGRGNELFVTIRLENSEELPFGFDTGIPITAFDKSVAPKLGQTLGSRSFAMLGQKQLGNVYVMPKIYLGNTLLMATTNRSAASANKNLVNRTVAIDFKPVAIFSGHPIMGALGLDILKHYCIQLDFEAGKLRFLDSRQLNVTNLGKAFPLVIHDRAPFIHCVNPNGGKETEMMIDLGCEDDGVVRPELIAGKSATTPQQEFIWEGETYTNVAIRTWPLHSHEPNLLGLRFLARHLVTLDFPNGMMYLKQISVGPLLDEDAESVEKFYNDLQSHDKLPGWHQDEHGGHSFPIATAETFTIQAWKQGNISKIYHYTFWGKSNDGSWKLQKAWLTDQNDKMIKEFPIP